MAVHRDLASMLRESLPQYLQAAKLLMATRAIPGPGVLGYPAAVLLFSVIDAIGSFHRGDRGVQIRIDNTIRWIKKTSDHFLILNGSYFHQTYSKSLLDRIYGQARCVLSHNAALAPNTVLLAARTTDSSSFWVEGENLYVG